MQRRHFLHTLLVLLGAPGLARITSAHAARTNCCVLIQQSPIAGFQYYSGEDIWPQLQPGQRVQLVREVHNRFDSQAVRVDWQGHKLGYLPRRQNYTISQMLDEGEYLYARISKLQYDPNPWRRIYLDVFMKT